jgi:hypothetical protein
MDADALRTDALRRELPAAAAYLDVDLTDSVGLMNLAAVAITQLAWRNGPVELWHRAWPSRISDAEMMRANAATTRDVRGHLSDDVVARFTDALEPIRDTLTDPDRRLPDGRTVRMVAADPDDLQMYTDQVRAFSGRCATLVERLGSCHVVGALACYAAAACWKWWLAPGWPSIADTIITNLRRQPISKRSTTSHPTRPGEPNLKRLREKLLAGPDRLTALEARSSLLASQSARLPQDHGLSPRSWRLLPPAVLDLVIHLESPVESFRHRLDQTSPIPAIRARTSR